jgi:hypothetical protein
MPYTPISIDRKALTIMDVPFPDLQMLEKTADAIGSNMFEGFQPTKKSSSCTLTGSSASSLIGNYCQD